MQISDDGVYLCLRPKYTAGRELTYAVRVAGYFRSVMTESIVMTDDYAEKAELPYHIGTIYTDRNSESIKQSVLIAGKQDKDMIMETYRTFMEIMDMMVRIFVFAAVILGVVVLYNLGIMSYVERQRELATLKVLGFRDKRIGSLLISQNLWLTVLGVLLGLPMCVGVLTYSVSILVTFGVSLIVGWMVARKNNHFDMVEALKGRE